jgi:hypothetical protein
MFRFEPGGAGCNNAYEEFDLVLSAFEQAVA